jgi:hypothetical protein
MPVNSHDLPSLSWKNIDISWLQPPNTVLGSEMYARKPSMTWIVDLLEFILNQLVELVKCGVCYSHIFKERHMAKIFE